MQKRSSTTPVRLREPDGDPAARPFAAAADQADQGESPTDAAGLAPVWPDGKNPAAVALGRLGGLKGGKARAAKLSAEDRSEIARKAAIARWSYEHPQIAEDGDSDA